MAEYYFINQRIITRENSIVIGDIDSDVELEPIGLLSGAKLSPEPTYIKIQLSETSGDYYPDIISSLITLYSNKVKNCLERCGVDNIDYYPVAIKDPKNCVNADYWFVNILGRISCLDVDNSDVEVDAFGDGLDFKSFAIDESRTAGTKIFRLHERSRLVIIHESIYSALSEIGLKGVIMENTRNYDGYGM
jgi:hypothetical protein